MAMTEAKYLALEGNVRELFKGYIDQLPDLNKGYFNIMTDATAVITDYMMGAAGQMVPWTGSVSYDEVDLTYSKTYRPKKFSTGIQLDRDLIEDGEYKRLVPKIVSSVANGIATWLNAKGASFWNDAFSGSLYTTADGAALCSASHYMKSGGTAQSNLFALPLSYANLETVLKAGKNLENDRGDKMLIGHSRLIAGMNLDITCKQLFGSEREAYVADNQINAYKDFSYSIHPLIDGDVWFVVNPMLMLNGSGANFWMRRDPRNMERDGDAAKGDFNTEKLSWKNVGRVELGATNWTWLLGSNPS